MRVRYFIMILFLILSCEEKTYENPVDPDTELSPDDWAPTSLTIEILTDSDVKLSWQKSEIEATGFKIERQDTLGGVFVEVGTVDTTIYSDTGLITGNEYLYQVYAYSGDNKSGYATSDTIVTTFPAPYDMTAVPDTNSMIILAWSDSTAYESGFVIERKNILSDAFTVLDSTVGNTHQDTTVTLGNEYVYKVGAYSEYNTSSTDTISVKYWQDCSDTWGGSAILSGCDNVCNSTAVVDCAGVCGGTHVDSDCGTVTDIDGNTYKTIIIGTQTWMAENLKVVNYRNSDDIHSIAESSDPNHDWSHLDTGAYCIYNNEISYLDIYGNLYNGYAVNDSRGLCMEGWHVPSDDEFKQLEMELGMSQEQADDFNRRGTNEGSQLAGNIDLWGGGGGNLTNDFEFGTSGFNALPGGYRPHMDRYCDNLGNAVFFWTASEEFQGNWSRGINASYTEISRSDANKRKGFSIRCIKSAP